MRNDHWNYYNSEQSKEQEKPLNSKTKAICAFICFILFAIGTFLVGFSAYRIVKKSFLIQTNAVITDIVKVRKGVGDYYYILKSVF